MPKRGGVQAIYATIANLGSTANKFHVAWRAYDVSAPTFENTRIREERWFVAEEIHPRLPRPVVNPVRVAILVHALVTGSAIFIPYLKADCEIIEMRLPPPWNYDQHKVEHPEDKLQPDRKTDTCRFNRRRQSKDIQSSSAELKLKISSNWLDRQVDLLSWELSAKIWKLSAVWSEGSLRFK